MLSAGRVFFYGIILLRLRRGGIAPALHEQIDRGYKIRIGDERHHTVILLCIPDRGKENIGLGLFAEVVQILGLDAKGFQFLALPQQALHTGLSHQLFIILRQSI